MDINIGGDDEWLILEELVLARKTPESINYEDLAAISKLEEFFTGEQYAKRFFLD